MKTPGTPDKKRIIVDYNNVTPEILELFSERYPYGYEDEDIIKFKNSRGENVKAIPFETKDTKYLIKVSVEMDRKIEAFLDDEEIPELPGDDDSISDSLAEEDDSD